MAKGPKKACCKMDKKVLLIVAAVIVVAVAALVMIQRPTVEPQPPEPVEPVCGDGVCASGETCLADCPDMSETSCNMASDCRVDYGPCGSVRGCVNVNVPPEPQTEMVACTQPLLENLAEWHNTYCECEGNICVAKVNYTKACSEFCEGFGSHPSQGAVFWSEHCAGEECPTHDFTKDKTIEQKYNELVESCGGDYFSPEFEACMRQPVAQEYEDWCEYQSGYFGQIGLNPVPYCNLLTSDGGNSCTDSSQCESGCYAQGVGLGDPMPMTGVTGQCASYQLVVGCVALVENGVVNGVMCID